MAALVHVLQDIRDGRYKPDEPLVHGLTMALDRALGASVPTRVDTTSRPRGAGC